MYIIGLVGGSVAERDAVAAAFYQVDKTTLGIFSLRDPVNGEARAKLLDEVIIKLNHSKYRNKGLVLPHVITREEAQWITAKGGFLLHVDGMPSRCIPIKHHDLLVTAKPDGYRHYLGPLEALSEVIIRDARSH